MDRLINGILSKMLSEKLVNEDDIEIYQFGLECLLLQLIHIISYIVIGICAGELFSLIVSGSILIPLRRKAGGYHAKTRLGCYLFSCCVVLLLCLVNKAEMALAVRIIEMLAADTLILLFAPLENENRELEPAEKIRFRKQAIVLLLLANAITGIIFLLRKYLFLAYWIDNGVLFTGLLLALGVKGTYGKKRNAEAALASAKKEVHSTCVFLGYQPKMPQKVRELKTKKR